MKSVRCTLSQVLQSQGKRFNPPYYANEAVDYYNGLEKCPYPIATLGDNSERIFFCNIFSRNFVKDPEHGIPYLTPTEMLKVDMEQAKLLSKKQASALTYLRVKSGWILISCSGSAALGSVALADERHVRMIATHDLIRFVPKEKDLNLGVLVAFLKSRFGKTTLTHSQYGSCILHINPKHVSSIRVPVFPVAFQKRIHKLITESARLREEADAALKASLKLFEDVSGEHGFPHETLTGRATYRSICALRRRMDAEYQLGMQRVAAAKQSGGCEQKRIGAVAKSLFVGGRGKRNYSTTGVPFISSSDMMLFNARRGAKFISKRSPGSETMVVHDNDILISRSGTVGNVIIVGRDLNGVAVSEHALRLVVDESQISPAYVFCYLKTSLAKRCMESSAYGSVIITLNEDLIADMTIPMLPRKTYDRIVTLISDYKDKLATATELENEAIDAVEAEIESWQGE